MHRGISNIGTMGLLTSLNLPNVLVTTLCPNDRNCRDSAFPPTQRGLPEISFLYSSHGSLASNGADDRSPEFDGTGDWSPNFDGTGDGSPDFDGAGNGSPDFDGTGDGSLDSDGINEGKVDGSIDSNGSPDSVGTADGNFEGSLGFDGTEEGVDDRQWMDIFLLAVRL